MITSIHFIGCRINCYLFGIPQLGFSIPIRGWAHPNAQGSKLWHFPIPIKIVETKYHFEMEGSDKLLSFSLPPGRSNTEKVYKWLQSLHGRIVKVKEPYTETPYYFPDSYFGKKYKGEIYPEEPGIPPSHADYRDRVGVGWEYFMGVKG